MKSLNTAQIKAAEFVHGIAAVVTGPGAGKTEVMMQRIGLLVIRHNVPPEQIIGVTFTRNAAEEMRARLIPVLKEQASRVTLSTMHAFAHYLLRNEGRTFEVLSGKDQLSFIKNLMKHKRLKDLSAGSVLREISLAKNNIISVEEFRSLYEADKTMQKIADIYENYDREKKKRYLLDFDDLLLETYYLLSNDHNARNKYTERYRHILVDEWQDTNPAQLAIIRCLAEDNNDKDRSLWCAGDDWQSIFSFCGASVGNILNFKSIFQDAQIFILNTNYRSTPQILSACQNLIKHNTRKIEKTLKTHNPSGEEVIVLEASSEEGEAMCLVNEIRELVEQRNYRYKDIAILYRARFQSRVIEETFSQMKIPYYIDSGLNFYQLSEVKYLLDYLKLIDNPDSEDGDESLKSIINIPNRYFSRKLFQELTTFAHGKNLHLFEALKAMPIDLPYVKTGVKDFVSFMGHMADYAPNLSPAEVLEMVRSHFDYDRYISDSDFQTPDDVKIQNLNQLQLSAARYCNISSFLDYTDSFDEQISDDKEGVALMTIHKSKGLQFRCVAVVGLVEGISPSRKGEIEEERRIIFVGISRAMEILYLCHSHNYLGQPSKKSVFIDEILNTSQKAKAS